MSAGVVMIVFSVVMVLFYVVAIVSIDVCSVVV